MRSLFLLCRRLKIECSRLTSCRPPQACHSAPRFSLPKDCLPMLVSRLAIAAILFLGLAGFARAAEPKISFTRQIKPILASKCFACHGPDEKERKAELR